MANRRTAPPAVTLAKSALRLCSPFIIGATNMPFVDVAAVTEIPAQRGRTVRVMGRSIALFKVGDSIHAIDDSCPHAGSSLGGGQLTGCLVRCPSHGLRFDVRNGRMPGNSGLAVPAYPVRIDEGRVHVAIDTDAAPCLTSSSAGCSAGSVS